MWTSRHKRSVVDSVAAGKLWLVVTVSSAVVAKNVSLAHEGQLQKLT